MFLATDEALILSGGTATRPIGRMAPLPMGRLARWRIAAREIDWVPDLGTQIGSCSWWRG